MMKYLVLSSNACCVYSVRCQECAIGFVITHLNFHLCPLSLHGYVQLTHSSCVDLDDVFVTRIIIIKSEVSNYSIVIILLRVCA